MGKYTSAETVSLIFGTLAKCGGASADLATVVDRLGFKPTKDEWEGAGRTNVPAELVAEPFDHRPFWQ